MTDTRVTRRTLLRSAAGAGVAAAATGAIPAWARPTAGTHLRHPDSLPFPKLPAGHPSMPEIKHIVVLMMENHSFDNILGMVPHQVPGRQSVDGLRLRDGRPVNFNRDAGGHKYHPRRASSPCQPDSEPSQAWDASHQSYDRGRNDGFVRACGPVAMEYWDKRDVPFTYSLAKHFPIGERYFCSVLAQTYPNRRFFFAGTASGLISTSVQTLSTPAANGTIYDRLDAHGINYGNYFQEVPSWFLFPGILNNPARSARQHPMAQFYVDVAAGRLPQFTFIDPQYTTTSEENPQDIQVGEQFVARVINALIRARTWKHTVIFLTYDEHGGYYDHVPPPRAMKPDSIPPMLGPGDVRASYDRYGFRVPLIVISPWARRGYVSRVVQDHTSMTAFIERKWNLPAMTFRDANADPMIDYFDFTRPAFATPPPLAAAPALGPGIAACRAHGFNPPLPTSPTEGVVTAERSAWAALARMTQGG
jgi:phospholipase C